MPRQYYQEALDAIGRGEWQQAESQLQKIEYPLNNLVYKTKILKLSSPVIRTVEQAYKQPYTQGISPDQ